MAFETTKLIRFHHCDPAGIVFYPQYLVLCNETVEDWFEQGLGVGFHALHHTLHRGIPMVRLECDFLGASRHGEALQFRLEVERIGNSSITWNITAGKDGKPRFRAKQTVVWADVSGPRPTAIDDAWRARFTRFMAPDPGV